jgi:hexokinase
MENITKLHTATNHERPPYDGNDMIINTEWCNFGSKKKHFPATWFDRKLDRESNNPNVHIFEKMTTGIYLGELVRIVLIHLVDNEMLFGGVSSEVLNTPYSFDTSYMYVCENDDIQSLDGTRVILEDMLKVGATTMADREIVRKVCEIIGERATMLVGAGTASVVQYMVEHGIGMDPDSPGFAICMCINLMLTIIFQSSHRCTDRLTFIQLLVVTSMKIILHSIHEFAKR